MKSTYRKYKHCQYLSKSADVYLNAIEKFYHLDYDFYESFTAFHKAWVLLFQSDILLTKNGRLFACAECKGEDKSQCEDPDHYKRKKGSSNPNDLYGLDAPVNKEYALETALNDLSNGHKGKGALHILENKYVVSEGTGMFKHLNDNSGFYTNLNIFRTIRNEQQHGTLEPNLEMAPIWQFIVLPYVIANARNYLETYFEMYRLHLDQIHARGSSKAHCACSKILSPEILKAHIRFPISYEAIFSPEGYDRLFNYEKHIYGEVAEIDKAVDNLKKKITSGENYLKTAKNIHPSNDVVGKIEANKNLLESKSATQKEVYGLRDLYDSEYGKEPSSLRNIIFRMWEKGSEDRKTRTRINIDFEVSSGQDEDTVGKSHDISVVNYYIYQSLVEVAAALKRKGLEVSSSELQKAKKKLRNEGQIHFESIYGAARYSQRFVDSVYTDFTTTD